MEKIICKLCDYIFDTQKELFEHAEKVHMIKIIREKDKISVRGMKEDK